MDQNRVENQVDEGTLQIHLTNASTGIPVKGARITISYTGGPQQVLEEVDTDDSGNTEKITLDAPPLEYSMEPGENQPYAEYTIKVQATGYRDITVSAINILSGEDATQEVVMEAQDAPGDPIDTIVIDAHTLYGEYPPKIPESEIKTVEETGEIVLSRVVIPEYVVVHDGAPGDSTAPNYYVRYRDYIKNVASSEIYATWTDAAIRANVLRKVLRFSPHIWHMVRSGGNLSLAFIWFFRIYASIASWAACRGRGVYRLTLSTINLLQVGMTLS